MPTAWRVRVIDERLRCEGLTAVVEEQDLYSLEGAARHAVLDALIYEAAEPPLVLVGDHVASVGEIDVERIVIAVRESGGRD